MNSIERRDTRTRRPERPAEWLHRLRNRFDRFLERHFPERLYARSLIIVVTPVVALQLIMTYIFMERHYETVTKSLAESYVSEASLLISASTIRPKDKAATDPILAMANNELKLGLVDPAEHDRFRRPFPSPSFPASIPSSGAMSGTISSFPFWLDTTARDGFVDLWIQVEPTTVFRFLTPIGRAHAPTRPLFLFAMVSSSLVLLRLAIIFLRGQIRPILRLAEAAQAFGMGREVANFRPSGRARYRKPPTPSS